MHTQERRRVHNSSIIAWGESLNKEESWVLFPFVSPLSFPAV